MSGGLKWIESTKCMEFVKEEKNRLIKEFLEDLHDRDNKRDCEYRCGGKPGEPCKHCTNYKHCDDNNYPIIKKYEAKIK